MKMYIEKFFKAFLEKKLIYLLLAISLVSGCNSEGTFDTEDAYLIDLQIAPSSSINTGTSKITVPIGSSLEFSALGYFSDDSVRNVSNDVEFLSGNNTIVIGHVIKGLAVGDDVITANLSGVTSNSVPLTVTDAELEDIRLVAQPSTVPKGIPVTLKIEGYYSDGLVQELPSELVSWDSDIPLLNIDSSNKLDTSDLNPDTYFIRANVGTVRSNEINVSVTQSQLLSLTLSPESISAPAGFSTQLQLIGHYSDESEIDLTHLNVDWFASSSAITVDSSGLLKVNRQEDALISVSGAVDGVFSNEIYVEATDAKLTNIVIHSENGVFETTVGLPLKLLAMGHFSSGGESVDISQDVDWYSSDSDIGTVVDGLFQSSRSGTTNIHASVDGVTSEPVTITVEEASLTSIDVGPVFLNLPLGIDGKIEAVGNYSDGRQQDISSQVSWHARSQEHSDYFTYETIDGITSIQDTGKTISGLSVYAQFDGVESDGNIIVNFSEAEVESISMTTTRDNIPSGTSSTLIVTAHYSNGDEKDISANSDTNYSVSSANILMIEKVNGVAVARGLNVGHVDITASFGSKEATYSNFTVTDAELVKIEISTDSVEVPLGTQVNFSIDGYYTDDEATAVRLDPSDVIWSSSNENVFTLIEAAKYEANNIGNADISAETSGGLNSNVINIEAVGAILTNFVISLEEPSDIPLPKGLSTQVKLFGTYSNDPTPVDLTLSSDVTWQAVSDEVSINQQGVVTARGGNGSGDVTATLRVGDMTLVSEPFTISTAPAKLMSIYIVQEENKSDIVFYSVNPILEFVAMGVLSDSELLDLTDSVTWNSDDIGVASFNESSLLRANSLGRVNVSAMYDNGDEVLNSLEFNILISSGVCGHDFEQPLGIEAGGGVNDDDPNNAVGTCLKLATGDNQERWYTSSPSMAYANLLNVTTQSYATCFSLGFVNCEGDFFTFSYDEAENFCAALNSVNFAGYSSWSMPLQAVLEPDLLYGKVPVSMGTRFGWPTNTIYYYRDLWAGIGLNFTNAHFSTEVQDHHSHMVTCMVSVN